MQDFRKLDVWRKAHELTLEIYLATKSFPREETFGITTQIRRASSSIGANLAEGCGRGGGELGRYCSIAMGSASETEYHLLLARDLKMLSAEHYEDLSRRTSELKRMLAGLMQKVRPTKLTTEN